MYYLLEFKLSHLDFQDPQSGTNGRSAPLQLQCLLEVEQEFKRVAAAQTSNTPNLTLRFLKVVLFSLKEVRNLRLCTLIHCGNYLHS